MRISIAPLAITLILAVSCSCAQSVPLGAIRAGATYPASGMHWPGAPTRYDTPPKLIYGKAPGYPRSLLGTAGVAVIDFTVGKDGKPFDFRVVQCSHAAFGAVTLAAVQNWRFEPGRKHGVPVSVKARLVLPFISGGTIGLTNR